MTKDRMHFTIEEKASCPTAQQRHQISMSITTAWSNELLVNTTTTSDQSKSTITALADGRFVVAWTDKSATGGDTDGLAIRAQLFTADGRKAGGELLVNSTTISTQIDPKITALADGHFVVAWTDSSATGGDTDGTAIRAQVFNTDGSKAGDELLINTTTISLQRQPAITALGDGRFVVTWSDYSGAPGIRAQLFHADGTRDGGERLVTTTSGDRREASISGLSDGRFVVTWTDNSTSVSGTRRQVIRGQLFRADGSKDGGELLVNTTTERDQYQSTILALADGRFVIAWTDARSGGGDQNRDGIRFQLFHADGSKDGGERRVNTMTSSHQTESTGTALADGRYVIAWTDARSGGGASG